MQRKILTFRNSSGEVEDLIPYVDDLAIQIGGTNLRDYLAQIEENLEIAKKYLGAFENETALFSKYPDGSELPEGVYAIVTDIDALYIYDTDSKRWLRTASATLGVLQVNGLTPINGSLTITGGDIQSTVSNADTTTQTITNHLDSLYSKVADTQYVQNGLIASGTFGGYTVNGDYVDCKINVDARYKKCDYISFQLGTGANLNSSNKNKNIRLNVVYSDGTSLMKWFYSSDAVQINMNKLDAYLGLSTSSQYQQVLVKNTMQTYQAQNLFMDKTAHPIIHTQNIGLYGGWTTNDIGTGYKLTLLPPVTTATSFVVLSISKKKDNIYTTAVVDYQVTSTGITIYSDEQFDGLITYMYKVG